MTLFRCVYSTFWVGCPDPIYAIGYRSVINYQPGDVITAATSSAEAAAFGTRKNKAYLDDLRLRMMGAFLYQEENAFPISEQTARGLNRLVWITCNDFL